MKIPAELLRAFSDQKGEMLESLNDRAPLLIIFLRHFG